MNKCRSEAFSFSKYVDNCRVIDMIIMANSTTGPTPQLKNHAYLTYNSAGLVEPAEL
jgi:hypothetical protein